MTTKPLIIYHDLCADGFGAAWAIWKVLGYEGADYLGTTHGNPPPDVTGRDVVIVDFSFKRDTIISIATNAKSVLILDHHKTAKEDLQLFAKEPNPVDNWDYWFFHNKVNSYDTASASDFNNTLAIFNMDKSGAVLAWEFFHPNKPVPKLLRHVQDRDLWLFKLNGTKELQFVVFSHPYDFEIWDQLAKDVEDEFKFADILEQGVAIERKHLKDIKELLSVAAHPQTIGGCLVLTANLPYTMASDACNILCKDYDSKPFSATYFDRADGQRVFSLRSVGDFDVSAVAKLYGGGGHKNAAGFSVPIVGESDHL